MRESMEPTWTGPEICRVLGIQTWLLTNFTSRNYPYRIRPSVRGARGRGKRARYTLLDIYKIAIAARLLQYGFPARVIGQALRWLSRREPEETFKQRPPKERTRYLVIQLWENKLHVSLEPWEALPFMSGMAIALKGGVFLMDFDALLEDVENRILGRKRQPESE